MDLRITEVPDDLHRALKIRAAEKGVSLKDLIIDLLTEALEAEAVA